MPDAGEGALFERAPTVLQTEIDRARTDRTSAPALSMSRTLRVTSRTRRIRAGRRSARRSLRKVDAGGEPGSRRLPELHLPFSFRAHSTHWLLVLSARRSSHHTCCRSWWCNSLCVPPAVTSRTFLTFHGCAHFPLAK
jgi:hypothetical protein